MLPALAIFILTLTLVIWQPRGLGIGWSASLGAVLALLIGVVHLSDIQTVWHIVWNATGAFVAVILISLLLDASGFFEWAALHVARWGGGRGVRLDAVLQDSGVAGRLPAEVRNNPAVSAAPASVESDFVNPGGTDLGREMTQMISTQRTYEANAQVVRTGDAMLGTLLDLKA